MSYHIPPQKLICSKCQKYFTLLYWVYKARLKASKSGKLFCSSRCSALGDVKEKSPNWKNNATKRHNSSYYNKKFPHKAFARQTLNNKIRSNKIIKQLCIICGASKNIQAHHPNYFEPLKVIWLCRKHHGILRKGVKLKYG